MANQQTIVMPFEQLGESAQSIVLRGFARQVDKLNYPKIGVVKDLADDAGLHLLTETELKTIEENVKEGVDHLAAFIDMQGKMKQVLASIEMSNDEKLARIQTLLRDV